MIILIEMEIQIFTTLGALHNTGEHAGVLRNGCASAVCSIRHRHVHQRDDF